MVRYKLGQLQVGLPMAVAIVVAQESVVIPCGLSIAAIDVQELRDI